MRMYGLQSAMCLARMVPNPESRVPDQRYEQCIPVGKYVGMYGIYRYMLYVICDMCICIYV